MWPMPNPSELSLPTRTRTQSVEERYETGRAARARLSRRAIGEWAPAPDRPDCVDVLRAQEQVRVPELLPIRHARMAASPFAFYRGTAALMAVDLGAVPNSGLVTQLSGDAHLSNFGLFATPDRSLVFDLNDFDETYPGPFEWDLARLVTSFLVAARDNALSVDQARAITMTAAQSYRVAMTRYAEMNDLDIWYDRVSADRLMSLAAEQGGRSGVKGMSKTLDKARKRDRWSAINKLTVEVDGVRQFIDSPPLLARLPLDDDAGKRVDDLFHAYRRTLSEDRRELLRKYRSIDWAHKVVGIGSVGLAAFVVLLQGRDENDLLVIQVKQAVSSVLERIAAPSRFEQQGHRVVAGQRMMQASSDVFLGWVTGPKGRDYYVRQLRDMKWSPDITALGPKQLQGYGELCGHSLARAHARAGDAVALHAYLGRGDAMDRALYAFADRYAAQVELDYRAFTEAVHDGVLAQTEDEAEAVALSLHSRFVH